MAIDAQMTSTVTSSSAYPTWDFNVVGNIVPIIQDTLAEQQSANVAAFLQIGTIPQLPGIGVDWTGYLTGNLSFGDLDQAIRASLLAVGLSTFSPNYDIVGSKLTTTIIKGGV
jgi:hypothetical protein